MNVRGTAPGNSKWSYWWHKQPKNQFKLQVQRNKIARDNNQRTRQSNLHPPSDAYGIKRRALPKTSQKRVGLVFDFDNSNNAIESLKIDEYSSYLNIETFFNLGVRYHKDVKRSNGSKKQIITYYRLEFFNQTRIYAYIDYAI